MSFWRTFGFQSISPIETILDRDSYTLEELLDEDDILQETRSQNKRLVDFLKKPEVASKLFYYVTHEPEGEPGLDNRRRYKYAFLCSEILCSDVWPIYDAIYEQENLLDELFSYLDKDPPLNPILSSYVCKVAATLLQRRVQETFKFMKKKDLISRFIKHLGTNAIMDLLLKVIACEDASEGIGIIQWLNENNFIPRLIANFDPALEAEVHENVGQALIDIVAVSSTSGNGSLPLMAQLEKEEIVQQLLGYILTEGAQSTLLHGLGVLIELINRHSQDTYNSTATIEDLPPFLRYILNHAEKINQILLTPSSRIFQTTAGEIRPLGFHKLKVVDFFLALVRSNFKCVNSLLCKLNIFNTCLDLFFAYPFNNFLHSLVDHMIITALRAEDLELKLHLVEQCGLAKRIVAANKEVKETPEREPRKGYMGFVTDISSNLDHQATGSEPLKKAVESVDGWMDYISKDWVETRNIETKPLGGPRPLSLGPDEESFDGLKSDMVYQYLVQQGFPKDFADEDDYDDDDHNGEVLLENDSDFVARAIFSGAEGEEENYGLGDQLTSQEQQEMRRRKIQQMLMNEDYGDEDDDALKFTQTRDTESSPETIAALTLQPPSQPLPQAPTTDESQSETKAASKDENVVMSELSPTVDTNHVTNTNDASSKTSTETKEEKVEATQ